MACALNRIHLTPVAALWLCFLAKALFYSSFIPLWEGPDEFAHVAFIQHLANTHSLPRQGETSVSREIAESLQLAPVPWTLRRPPQWLSHDDYWRLPPAEREVRQNFLRNMPRAWGSQPAQPPERSYEAQQPPLAYVLFLLPWLAFQDSDLATRVWILRIAGSLLASTVIPLGFLIAMQVFRNPWRAVAIASLIASMPELLLTVTRVGNEPLAVFLGTVCTYLLLRPTSSRDLMPGVAIGLALLTKAYFLVLLPVVWLRRQPLVATCTALAISGWWYVHNMVVTGTLTGEQSDAAASHSGISALQALTHANWVHAIDFALVSHIWLGGWSFLVVRTWMYRLVELALLAAVVGVALRFRRNRQVAICAALAACFWIAPAYHALQTFRARGAPESFGYYAYCLVAAEAVCLAAGLWWRFAVPVLVACFAALEIYGAVFMLMPYYAGFTAHSAQGGVPALHLSMLSNGGLNRLFLNLAAFKPPLVSAGTLEAMCAAFLLSIAGIVSIAFFAAHRDRT